jgi:protein-disulfide isomerase
MHQDKDKKEMSDEVIQIPVGKWLYFLKHNHWRTLSIILGVLLIVSLFFVFRGSSGAVSGEKAASNLIDFVNSQGNGVAEFVSVEEKSGMYEVTVSFNGQKIPVYVTLDGKNLVSNVFPLDGSLTQEANPTGSNEPIDVSVGGSPSKGSKSAKVTVVEFTDYQCPFCAKYYSESYKKIVKNYVDTGKVLYVIKDFPLNFHDQAQKAAEAARCVGDQKGDTGYFRMHDKLFENQQSLSEANYKVWAKEIGVDAKKFDECLTSGKFADGVKADLAYGQQIGISGTPGFFVNGKLVSGAQPYSVFEQLIEAELDA